MAAKEETLELMKQLPDDTNVEVALNRLIVPYLVQQGLGQLDNGEGIPHDEAKRRIRQ